ncbi:MAG: 3'-5' exonuclease [Muribaculaceae bacterium]|nr:3'-5' exonuclease [Muribaculaceae bacterium]MBR3100790.1 3'-5' exonuclease [Muribaculaceae bacterium]
MELKLKNPIIFFDVESTGLNITTDRIVEISYVKIYPNGREERHTYLVNPEMPIPQQAVNVHHITDEMVKDAPVFKQLARTLASVFEGCDIAGFNSNQFDIPLLAQEMNRAGVEFDVSRRRFIDVQTIFHKKEKRDLEAAYRFYCGKEMENHHSSMCDAQTTYEVLKGQLDRYPDLENDVEFLSQYSSHNNKADLAGRFIYDEQRRVVVNFGKYKGQVLAEVLKKDPSYYSWMMRSDFAENTKQVLTRVKMNLNP